MARSFFKKTCKGQSRIFKMSQDVNLVKKFGKEKFDFVISSGVMDYSRNPDKVISNVKQILRPGGYFAFTLFDNLSTTEYDGKSPKQRYISSIGIKTWGFRDSYIVSMLNKLKFPICKMSLGKRLHKNRTIELSHTEIEAIKKKMDHPYDDHFVILVRKK